MSTLPRAVSDLTVKALDEHDINETFRDTSPTEVFARSPTRVSYGGESQARFGDESNPRLCLKAQNTALAQTLHSPRSADETLRSIK